MKMLTCARKKDWIGCVDFGTAYSKFAMVRAIDREELSRDDVRPLPVAVSDDYRGSVEWLLPSVIFLTDCTILFGEQAQREALRAHGSVREAFSSPKQYLSTYDLSEYDALLTKEIDPTGHFTARKLLRLFMAYILERAGAHATVQKLPWPVPLRVARPAWDSERAQSGEKLLQDLIINGFGIIDLVGSDISRGRGLPIPTALKVLRDAEENSRKAQAAGAIGDGMFMLGQYGRASVPEATAVAASSTRRRGRRIVVVADIGGGTSDFGSFMTPVRGNKTVAEISGSSQILKEAGDFLDMQLIRIILDAAGYSPSHPAGRGVYRRLLAQSRSNKEELFLRGELIVDVNEILIRVTRDKFLQDENVQAFTERLEKRFHATLLKAKQCAETYAHNGFQPPIEIVLTGGGYALPMVKDLVANPRLPGLYVPTSPEILEDDEAFPFDSVRPQLAVAIGGAMKDLPTTRMVMLASESDQHGTDAELELRG